MYSGQQVRVMWNGVYSRTFPPINDVNQGAIISPILFCVYLHTLLLELKRAGLGCYVGHWFAAALAYADDAVLLAPTAHAMRSIIAICDRYACEFNVTFNGKKSKYMMFNACNNCSARNKTAVLPHYAIGGHAIESVLTLGVFGVGTTWGNYHTLTNDILITSFVNK